MADVARRPDPDALLAQVEREAGTRTRGRLKVFVGAAPGVGKTFTMLEAARLRQRDGVDVVVGVVETHGRGDTAAMVEGFEVLPRRAIVHRGTTLEEFDLEAALARRPALLLVDELAHTNDPGAPHGKRWQDVQALLDAGIDVWSTLNVQHLESLNDVVAGITGVQVRETVPDAVLDAADEVELVDVSSEVLEQRLRDGKVYVATQAQRALDRFFRRGNLIALRELALRRTAERVDAQMRGWRASAGIAEPWAASEQLVACVGPSPSAQRIVRAARRLAGQLNAPWLVVHVEQPGDATRPAADRELVNDALRLAEELGAQVTTVSGHDVAAEVLAVAGRVNATRVLVGRSHGWRARVLAATTPAARLAAAAGDIDVVLVGDREREPARAVASMPARVVRTSPWREYGIAVALVAATTLVGLPFRDRIVPTDVALVFLLAIVLVAARGGRGPALLATTLAVLVFDVLFVPPYGTLAVSDVRFTLTFVVMFVVGVTMGGLTRRVREQAEAARLRERRTATLYALSRELAAARHRGDVGRAMLRHVHDLFGGRVALIEPSPDEPATMQVAAALPQDPWPDPDLAVARWSHDRLQPAGRGTTTLPAAAALYVPLGTTEHRLGVVGLVPDPPDRLDDADERQLLEAMLDQAAVALDRTALADRARQAHLEAEAEKLRNALLSSLSHDLRTPLASVEGAASTLLRDASLPVAQRDDLATTIVEESQRMGRLVANLLDMVRLESGSLQVHREWHVLEEVVGSALLRIESRAGDRAITTHLPTAIPLVAMDDVLIEQVLVNLLENALRHTPAGTPIEVAAEVRSRELVVTVADRGAGVAPADAERIFGKFERGSTGASGIGLGLSICAGIVRAHGGRIWVDAREGGGAAFRFSLPMLAPPPAIDADAGDPA
ncbi:MAG: sensor histidine kinase KdpD [Gemmatimonadaceae bacterium]|nr:sensor histidine kinase KdpD [Gemmatimonadaceae bacterium]